MNCGSGATADLPPWAFNEIYYSHHRYLLAFETPEDIQDRIPPTDVPHMSLDGDLMIPMMIEAPLSSVEVLEAILKPQEPFQIHKARHIPHGPATRCKDRIQGALTERRRLYDEYAQFQGRLERDREISFICIPFRALRSLRSAFNLCWPICLHYISISWGSGSPRKGLYHPWALVLRDRPGLGLVPPYKVSLHWLLEQLGIPDCRFERSLLPPGTIPLPDCVLDWVDGLHGISGALPYYAHDHDLEETTDSSRDLSEEGSGETMYHLLDRSWQRERPLDD